ncbi:LLM class flavin-dependent oxidoreductase [Rhodococcus sp. Eu-32]|uniref:LLM class flavin-dependent oxidoreductase n=1 Tax=Rhodococcus sp. Eu-32 TaxID=1017319 RepID=UPI000DF36371|nr:LLM class flavin-dependent oxidoreductase [Rhodococcus sp. Eu-32]RRQ29456.1 LLM class flavin-dependent oxidoreductase [Rhodococcus sp. Eu-32]
MSNRNPVPVGVRLGRGSSLTIRGLVHAAERLDRSATGFVVLGTKSLGYEPSTIAGFLARRTSGLGLVVEAAVQRDHPYNIARRTASLDHLTQGRVGWWVREHDDETELGLGEASSWTSAPPRDRTEDAVIAVRALWRTWPADAVVGDVESNVFTRAERIRHADHDGIFTTAGPLTVPTTPQGEPVVFGPGSSDVRVGADGVAVVAVDGIDDAIASGVAGLVVEIDDVDLWIRVLPNLVARGVVKARTDKTTLRQYLGVDLPAEPDLSTRRPAFI